MEHFSARNARSFCGEPRPGSRLGRRLTKQAAQIGHGSRVYKFDWHPMVVACLSQLAVTAAVYSHIFIVARFPIFLG